MHLTQKYWQQHLQKKKKTLHLTSSQKSVQKQQLLLVSSPCSPSFSTDIIKKKNPETDRATWVIHMCSQLLSEWLYLIGLKQEGGRVNEFFVLFNWLQLWDRRTLFHRGQEAHPHLPTPPQRKPEKRSVYINFDLEITTPCSCSRAAYISWKATCYIYITRSTQDQETCSALSGVRTTWHYTNPLILVQQEHTPGGNTDVWTIN